MLRSGPRLGKHKMNTPDGDFCVDALQDVVSQDPSEHSLVRTTISPNLSILEERAKAACALLWIGSTSPPRYQAYMYITQLSFWSMGQQPYSAISPSSQKC